VIAFFPGSPFSPCAPPPLRRRKLGLVLGAQRGKGSVDGVEQRLGQLPATAPVPSRVAGRERHSSRRSSSGRRGEQAGPVEVPGCALGHQRRTQLVGALADQPVAHDLVRERREGDFDAAAGDGDELGRESSAKRMKTVDAGGSSTVFKSAGASAGQVDVGDDQDLAVGLEKACAGRG